VKWDLTSIQLFDQKRPGDVEEALVDAPFVHAFLDAAEAAFDQEKPKTTVNLVGMLAKVARGELPVAASGTPSIARSLDRWLVDALFVGEESPLEINVKQNVMFLDRRGEEGREAVQFPEGPEQALEFRSQLQVSSSRAH
jgi:hypothetical protein